MPDILEIFLKWWKQILSFIIICLIASALIVFLKPVQYLSAATALPAPTYSSDKAGIFSENLQSLYPAVGTPDDLDMIVGTSHLDTVYYFIVDQHALVDYYQTGKKDERNPRQKAAIILKANTKVTKTDYGELKVKVWDRNREKAADFANAIMDKLRSMHQDIQNMNNRFILDKIIQEKILKQTEFKAINDTLAKGGILNEEILLVKRNNLLQQISEYEKLSNEYELMVKARPEALIIVEKARSSAYPDKPRRLQVITATLILSLIFSFLTILVIERTRLQG